MKTVGKQQHQRGMQQWRPNDRFGLMSTTLYAIVYILVFPSYLPSPILYIRINHTPFPAFLSTNKGFGRHCTEKFRHRTNAWYEPYQTLVAIVPDIGTDATNARYQFHVVSCS
ncbi:MAG: hypothetical protein SPI30_07540 [Prevotella sp.]|nr:hypothetical protein [Prevotella sp.]